MQIYSLFLSAYIEYSIRELDCDFECFADSIPPRFYGQLAIFFAAEATVDLIDWAIATGIVECPS